jgi:hypothetical protein
LRNYLLILFALTVVVGAASALYQPGTQILVTQESGWRAYLGDDPAYWSARLELCQWIRETLDKESVWDEARSTSLSR